MKKFRFIFILLLFLPNLVHSQELSDDSLLMKVAKDLPIGWTAKLTDSILILEYEDSVWVAHGNWINASKEQWKLKNDRDWIMSEGKKTKLVFMLQAMNKMDEDRLKLLRSMDDSAQGPWFNEVYNSENFTLRMISSPAMDNQYNAIWPHETGGYQVWNNLKENLIML